MAKKTRYYQKEVAERKMQHIALEIAGQLYNENDPLIIIGIVGIALLQIFSAIKYCGM